MVGLGASGIKLKQSLEIQGSFLLLNKVLSAPLGFGTRHDGSQNYDIYDLGKSNNSITMIFDYGNGNLFYQGYLKDGTFHKFLIEKREVQKEVANNHLFFVTPKQLKSYSKDSSLRLPV